MKFTKILESNLKWLICQHSSLVSISSLVSLEKRLTRLSSLLTRIPLMHLTPITMEEFPTNLCRFVNSLQLQSFTYLKYEHFALSSSQQGKMTYRILFTDLYKSIDRTNLLASQFKNSNEPKSTAFPQRLQVKYFFKILFRRAP